MAQREFFDPETGLPMADPRLLPASERKDMILTASEMMAQSRSFDYTGAVSSPPLQQQIEEAERMQQRAATGRFGVLGL